MDAALTRRTFACLCVASSSTTGCKSPGRGLSIDAVEEAVAHAAAGLKIAINDAAALDGLSAAISGERRGRIAVVVEMGDEGEVEITLPGAYTIAAQTRMKLQTLPG